MGDSTCSRSKGGSTPSPCRCGRSNGVLGCAGDDLPRSWLIAQGRKPLALKRTMARRRVVGDPARQFR